MGTYFNDETWRGAIESVLWILSIAGMIVIVANGNPGGGPNAALVGLLFTISVAMILVVWIFSFIDAFRSTDRWNHRQLG